MTRQPPAPQPETWADYIDRLKGFRPPTARLVRAQIRTEPHGGGQPAPANQDGGGTPTDSRTDKD